MYIRQFLFFIFFSLLISFQAVSQSASTAAVMPEYKAEMENWLVNIDEAYALSTKTGKPILANFTGSDWCGWCKRLKASVFEKPEFKKWAEENVVLLELDFPSRKYIPENIKAQNASLQKAFTIRGYPTIWVFNLKKDEEKNQYEIEAFGSTGYAPTVEQFTGAVDSMLKK